MRASETRALRAIRSRATLVARAAPRRAANAGQVRLIESKSDSRVRTDWMENKRAGSVGSPLVATGRGRSFTESSATSKEGTQGWGEAKIWRLDRSPPVVSRGAWGEEKSGEGSGSPPVADSSSGASQKAWFKATSTPCETMEQARTWAKVRHLARQASVSSSPFQQAGILVPAAVHPGQAPRVT
jgi:hypothetical protein